MQNTSYREANRVHTSVLAAAEKRCLIWMARRLPERIHSDHLTTLAGIAMVAAGVCYWIGPGSTAAMVTAILMLGGHWFGDSRDGIVAAAFLAAYYLLMVEIALATHAVGTFRISFWKFGPTELRILLAIGTLQLLRSPYVTVAGEQHLLFDVGGVIAIVALLATFIASAVKNGRLLYRLEPLPPVH